MGVGKVREYEEWEEEREKVGAGGGWEERSRKGDGEEEGNCLETNIHALL